MQEVDSLALGGRANVESEKVLITGKILLEAIRAFRSTGETEQQTTLDSSSSIVLNALMEGFREGPAYWDKQVKTVGPEYVTKEGKIKVTTQGLADKKAVNLFKNTVLSPELQPLNHYQTVNIDTQTLTELSRVFGRCVYVADKLRPSFSLSKKKVGDFLGPNMLAQALVRTSLEQDELAVFDTFITGYLEAEWKSKR